MNVLAKLEGKVSELIYRLAAREANKQVPVKLGTLVRHRMTGYDGEVVGLQYEGWFHPRCRLSVLNKISGIVFTNIDRNEFTIAAYRKLTFPRQGYN